MDKLSIIDSILLVVTCICVLLIVFKLFSIVATEKKIKKKRREIIDAERYEILQGLGFTFTKKLYFEGIYRGFLIHVSPTTMRDKKNEVLPCNVIQAYYQPKLRDDIGKKIVEPISYHLGNLFFYHSTVIFIPTNFIQPDFKENFEGIVNILIREGYTPISKEDLMKLDEV